MTQENVDVVRRIWEAADRRDTQSVLALYDTDVELDLTGLPPEAGEGGIYRGHEGLQRLFREWREVWDDAGSRLVELVDAGDRVISVYTYSGRGRASGVPIRHTFAAAWTIRRGKAVRVEWFVGRREALEAAGLAE